MRKRFNMFESGQRYPSDRSHPVPVSKAMLTDDLRCPYCADGDQFRLLIPQGDLFRCRNCGHLSKPPLQPVVCGCENCAKIQEFRAADARDSSRDYFQHLRANVVEASRARSQKSRKKTLYTMPKPSNPPESQPLRILPA